MIQVILYVRVGWEANILWYSKIIDMPQPPTEGLYIYVDGRRLGPVEEVAWLTDRCRYSAVLDYSPPWGVDSVKYFDEHWARLAREP